MLNATPELYESANENGPIRWIGPDASLATARDLRDLVGDDHDYRDSRHDPDSADPERPLARSVGGGVLGTHSPDCTGPVIAGRAQRLESPPLLQSMHKRA